jgi:predicted LPLAT superfamily acyltransferase
MQTLESLNMSLTVLKSLLSDYAMRANQAEAIANKLMFDKLEDSQLNVLIMSMREHMDLRSKERAVHQQALIQATVLSLEEPLCKRLPSNLLWHNPT